MRSVCLGPSAQISLNVAAATAAEEKEEERERKTERGRERRARRTIRRRRQGVAVKEVRGWREGEKKGIEEGIVIN